MQPAKIGDTFLGLKHRRILGDRHYSVAERVREHLARYQELEDIITMLGVEDPSAKDQKIVTRARKLQRYMTQPFWATARHTRIAGASVPIAQTLDDCEAFLLGRYDDIPEEQCYMRGNMTESSS